MEIQQTSRGFHYVEFRDRYGSQCSLQESSLASEAAIWLGVDEAAPTGSGLPRMHLTQTQVRELLPLLQHFAATGRLSGDEMPDED